MRVMAIDYGDARIGLAVSDLLGLFCGEAWTMEEWNMERAALREAGTDGMVCSVGSLYMAGAVRACFQLY